MRKVRIAPTAGEFRARSSRSGPASADRPGRDTIPSMIARIWRGTTADRADEYVEVPARDGTRRLRQDAGQPRVSMLVRRHVGRADFTLISYWESMEHVKAFAGDDPEVAASIPRTTTT